MRALCSAVTGAGTARPIVHPFRATQVCRQRGNEARRGAKAGLTEPLSVAASRLRQLLCIHMAKATTATYEAPLLLVVQSGHEISGHSDFRSPRQGRRQTLPSGRRGRNRGRSGLLSLYPALRAVAPIRAPRDLF